MAKGDSDIYHGRLVADGNGNLLADEGPRAGEPVAYHEGSYVFLKPGEPSHNARHEQNLLVVDLTQDVDPDQPGYAGDADSPTEGNEHHFGILEDDEHYVEGAELDGVVTNTRLRFLPDAVAKKVGSTEQEAGDE